MTDLVAKFKELNLPSSTEFTQEQKATKSQWENISNSGQIVTNLSELNTHLKFNAFIIPQASLEPSETDAFVLEHTLPGLKDIISASKDIKSTVAEYRHIIRWALFLIKLLKITDEPVLTGINLDLDLPREIIEKKKKEDASKKEKQGSANETKKGNKQPRGKPDEETLKKLREEAKAKKAAKKAEKGKQQQQQQEADSKPNVSAIDFRVGFIEKAIKHPDADSLYVSTIDVGEEEGPRTVCSGLVKYFPLEAMQKRYVVVVCNLKPVNMRGVKSYAMVLCGSDEDKIEFVEPPAGSKPGDKVFFEGYGAEEPLKQLNPKKKIWEAYQPNFSTNDNLEVIFKDETDGGKIKKLTNAKGESFKVASIVHANVR
ncbi:probable GU4 nucleic-binding protein 1 [Saccharomycodes ludwigii]|uniref:Probable GU4 nucleic-binding protein 1 n=1 Tax=Saccharomycodes ludwigii TaxID=36035 RepID=A0A376BB59_9ASCO|nr:hypothetical protein SCDLUD_001029 [Saccharomycodes ludwigii]KAH3903394.1 hypothetical protein SCDLUD_001029 [Saccharomycodes ludwigii]SSD61819.1 probable GU4 nucleic-binding protein 1 [Saccharomycodes ludwigii]